MKHDKPVMSVLNVERAFVNLVLQLLPDHNYNLTNFSSLVMGGDYIKAVLKRNKAENITRVLYPNDNVSGNLYF